jgi:hypothetical protein
LGAALFHESTFNDLLWKGLSLTVGLRADYEKMDITHDTHTTMRAQAYMMGKPMGDIASNTYQVKAKKMMIIGFYYLSLRLKYTFDPKTICTQP